MTRGGPSTMLRARALHFALAFVAAFASTERASAQNTIRAGGSRPGYSVELEPHLLLTPFSPPGVGTGNGFGIGARGTFEILREGFIPSVNDSVGIGVGLDWIHYDGSRVEEEARCLRVEQAPNGIPVCVEVAGDTDYLWIPVVMQWNFWLHRKWSAFGEPGIALRVDDMEDFGLSPFVLYVGGRYHLSDRFSLTIRLGYPAFSFGGSFMF
jgi:hypothetical protein